MTSFFTSDEHYGHANIIKYCNRPFSDVNHMREAMIWRHNEVVGDEDIVYHLGDMFWNTVTDEEALAIFGRLKGYHSFLRGNHDKTLARVFWKIVRDFNRRVDPEIHDVLAVPGTGPKDIFLSHYSHQVWPQSHKGAYHLFGHSHAQLWGIGQSFDVGVDTHGFYPYSLSQVAAMMRELRPNVNQKENQKETE